MVTQFVPIWPTLGERASLQSTMRRCYKKSVLYLISTLCFPHHTHMDLIREYKKEALDPSNDVISLPKVITMFIPTLETPLTKILNPQVPPFVNPRPLASALLQKCCRIHLNTSHSSPKSCHDFAQSCRDCLWTTVVTSPFQGNLVRKLLNRVTIFQIVSRFSISKYHAPCQSNRVTMPRIVTRFQGFLNSQFEANIQQYRFRICFKFELNFTPINSFIWKIKFSRKC